MEMMYPGKSGNWWYGECADCGAIFRAPVRDLEIAANIRAAQCENCGCYINFHEIGTGEALRISRKLGWINS